MSCMIKHIPMLIISHIASTYTVKLSVYVYGFNIYRCLMHHSRFHLLPDCRQEIWFQPSFIINRIRSKMLQKHQERNGMSSVMGYLEAVYSRKYFRSLFILLPQGKFISQIYITDQRGLHTIKWWQQPYNTDHFYDNLISSFCQHHLRRFFNIRESIKKINK